MNPRCQAPTPAPHLRPAQRGTTWATDSSRKPIEMRDFTQFVQPAPSVESESALIAAASACLDRFTACFNAQDLAGMDGELHFPHVMLSGAERLTWPQPGQHPRDFFNNLLATGWHHTRYASKEAVLVGRDKVHFVVAYARCDETGDVLSMHTNLWIVTRVNRKWGISVRSY